MLIVFVTGYGNNVQCISHALSLMLFVVSHRSAEQINVDEANDML